MSFAARRSTAFRTGEIYTPRVNGRGTKNSIFTPMMKYQSSGSNLIDFSDYLHTEQHLDENSKNDTDEVKQIIRQRASKFMEMTEIGKNILPRKKFALEEFNQDQLLEVEYELILINILLFFRKIFFYLYFFVLI